MVQTRSASSSVTPRVTPPASSGGGITATPGRAPRGAKRSSASSALLTHTPSTLALLWLAISLPLVAWDTGYIMLRPHSMPGGKYHKPIWAPYELYGRVDGIYGFKAWDANNGFTAAQASLNVVETVMYLAYVAVCRVYAAKPTESKRVEGRPAAAALLVMYAALIMTVSKTLLYLFNEAWSGFDNVRHNSWTTLIALWVGPNCPWLIIPSYLIYTYTNEILDALAPPPSGSSSAVKAE